MVKKNFLFLLCLLAYCFVYPTRVDALIKPVRMESNDQYAEGALYRSEKVYLEDDTDQVISRVLTDGKGDSLKCLTFKHDQQGKLVKQTLYGNLSGTCQAPLILQPSGYPQDNGIESYSVRYEYTPGDPDLLWKEINDSGMITTYTYHPETKHCIAKLYGNENQILSRIFYRYDEKGFLSETTVDDGQGVTEDDLTGVTSRQMMSVILSHDLASLGQPLLTMKKYLDLATGREVLLEKTVYSYDEQGRPLQQDYFDANEKLRYYTHQNYDDKGNLTSTVDSRGEVALTSESSNKQKYNELDQLCATIDRFGNETEYRYDSLGRLIQTIQPAVFDEHDSIINPTITYKYDIFDQIIETTDALDFTKKTFYNVLNKPIEIIHPDGSSEKFTYFLDGTLKEKVAANGFKTCFKKDHLSRIICQEEFSPGGHLIHQSHYEYQGQRIIVIKRGAKTTRIEYDGAGREHARIIESPSGNKRTESSYDSCSQKIEIKEWYGQGDYDYVAKIEELDGWQNKVAMRVEKPNGEIQKRIALADQAPSEKFSFTQELTHKNQLDQYVKLIDHVNEAGTRQLDIYDALQRLDSSMKFNSLGEKLSEYHIRYDANGNKAFEKHTVYVQGHVSRSYLIRWTYDLLNRLTSIQEDTGSFQQKTTAYFYNDRGQLKTLVKPNGIAIHYQYHDEGTLAQFTADDESFNYTYLYDDQLRLIAILDSINGLTQTRRYNDLNELVEENLGSPFTRVRSDYDLAGRRTAFTLPDDSRILYHYDGVHLASIVREGPIPYHHSYHYEKPSGKLITSELPESTALLSYAYNQQGQFLSLQSPWWSENVNFNGYDSESRITSLAIEDLNGHTNYSYKYGEDGQLTAEEGHLQKNYQYDSLYNRLSEGQEPWLHNDFNQLIKAPHAEMTYDENGNLITKKTEEDLFIFEYDALNRLTKVILNDQQAVHYSYDAFNRQIQQKSYYKNSRNSWESDKTEFFLYDDNKEIGKVASNGQIKELRILGKGKGAEISAAIALELENRVYIPIHDHQGSVRCLVDMETQSVAEFYRYSAYGLEEIYDSYGSPIAKSNVGNPWRFSSKRCDEMTGFVDYGRRHYDPSIGRWTTPDPLFFYDTPNLYAFVRNDSINNHDLYGLFSIQDTWNAAKEFYDWLHFYADSMYGYLAEHINSIPEINSVEDFARMMLTRMDGNIDWFFRSTFHTDKSEVGAVGEKEISDKVRITFINGIMTTKNDMFENLNLISETHGGAKIHYIFRGTKGWSDDIIHCVKVKGGFQFGFRSSYTDLIVQKWRDLIQEVGGVHGGGTILHYAHSFGGTETERAKHLLTPEEKKMIKVITYGSSTFIDKSSFQSVVNHVSWGDFIYIIECLSGRNFFDENLDLQWHESAPGASNFLSDHPLTAKTYSALVEKHGQEFLKEFLHE